LELFKEKEEQDMTKKDFDPEQGIDLFLKDNIVDFDIFGKNITKPKTESNFDKLEHNVFEEYDEPTELNLDVLLEEDLLETQEIVYEIQEDLVKLVLDNED